MEIDTEARALENVAVLMRHPALPSYLSTYRLPSKTVTVAKRLDRFYSSTQPLSFQSG